MARYTAALLAACAMGALASPASAVIDGKFDGNEHPNVGIIMAIDAEGGGQACSGTLVAPSTFLTAAHCIADDPAFPPFEVIHVSFEPVAYDSPPERPLVPPKNAIEATADPHPDWTWEGSSETKGAAGFLRYQEKDVGVLHLARPAAEVYPGITPAPIVGAGVFDAIKPGSKPTITQVGYGTQRSGPPGQEGSLFLDGTRNQSKFPLTKIRPRMIFGHANPNDNIGFGMPCFGDSGSPWFFQGAVGAVYTAVNGVCNNGAGGTRLDTGPARDFLRSRGLVP